MADDLIRQRVAALAKAIAARDIDAVMAFFASGIVSCDLEPPLHYAGADKKRERWERDFAAFTSIEYEVRDLRVTTSGELAVAHALNHFKGTMADGRGADTWVRWTACWRLIDGAWLIVHDHVSVPADLQHGKAVLDLKP